MFDILLSPLRSQLKKGAVKAPFQKKIHKIDYQNETLANFFTKWH